MTGQEKQLLRELISQARRKAASANPGGPTCKGCGTARENRTTGCRTCKDRANKRARRTSSSYRQAESTNAKYRRVGAGQWSRSEQKCRGCGSPYDVPNLDCSTCDNRMIARTGTRKWRD